jgi:hypothetical protein
MRTVTAVMCDGTGRVLQYKDGGVWRFPTAPAGPEDTDARTAAAQALADQMGVIDAVCDDEPIDEGETTISFVFTGGTVPAAAGQTARWAPYDTIYDEQLGAKLMAR